MSVGMRLRLQNKSYLLSLLSIIIFVIIVVVGSFFSTQTDEEDKEELNKIIFQYFLPNHTNLLIVEDTWQDVPGSKEKMFVYSAFFERRGAFRLRVIGASSRLVKETLWCHLWYDEVPSVTVRATLQIIHEHHLLNYSACFILCPLAETFPVPTSVSIVTDPHSTPGNRLLVIDNNPEFLDRPRKLAVCIKPLFQYDNLLELVEFLELYKILGVDKAVIYAHTVSPHVQCALDSYSSSGDVTVFPWHLDLVSQVEIRSEGIFASLNDCLYRFMYRYSNIVVVDLDEFIIPHELDSLAQLITYLDSEYDTTRTVASYVFKNAFFYLNLPQYPSTVDESDPWLSRLYSTSKLRRKMSLESFPYRSKYVFKPERVLEVGNHFVWENWPGFEEVRVAPNVGLSHHYRVCELEPAEGDCSRRGAKLDRTSLRYQDRLLKKVKEKWEKMMKQCDFPDIKDFPNSNLRGYQNYTRRLN